MTEWLVKEYNKLLELYKDYLPTKAKKLGYPYFLWMSPPTHKYFSNFTNFKRDRQGHCLATVAKLQSNNSVLDMVKVWDPQDGISVLYDSTRFTSQGLTNYWLSIDSAIRFWNTAVFPKIAKNVENHTVKGSVKNKYKWHRKQ